MKITFNSFWIKCWLIFFWYECILWNNYNSRMMTFQVNFFCLLCLFCLFCLFCLLCFVCFVCFVCLFCLLLFVVWSGERKRNKEKRRKEKKGDETKRLSLFLPQQEQELCRLFWNHQLLIHNGMVSVKQWLIELLKQEVHSVVTWNHLVQFITGSTLLIKLAWWEKLYLFFDSSFLFFSMFSSDVFYFCVLWNLFFFFFFCFLFLKHEFSPLSYTQRHSYIYIYLVCIHGSQQRTVRSHD